MTDRREIEALFRKLEERRFRYYVVEESYRRGETFEDRRIRYDEVDRILRHEFRFKTPKGDVVQGPPVVDNLASTFIQDVSNLVTEMSAGWRAPILGDTKADETSAALREVGAATYWTKNHGDILEAQLATDLISCGAAYLTTYVDDQLIVPHIVRHNPRNCFPTIHNGILTDLLVVSTLPVNVADQLYPQAGIIKMAEEERGMPVVTIQDYFSRGLVARVITAVGKNGRVTTDPARSILVDAYETPDGCLPVAYAQLTSFDGAQRGLLDPALPILESRNKVAALLIKNLDDMVFSPFLAQNIMNPDEAPDDDTVYEALPDADRAVFERVQAAQPSNALFALYQDLNSSARAVLGYPESRSGVVNQSIASGSFVDATQGMLSTTTKVLQDHIAKMREQIHVGVAKYDKAYLDFEKPLAIAVGKKNTYVPSELWAEEIYDVAVSYGPNAGLSRGQSDVRDLQFLGAQVISKRTVREHVGEGYLKDRLEEQDAIEIEEGENAVRQVFWPDPNIPMDLKMQVLKIMRTKGLSLSEAVEKANKENEATIAEQQNMAAQDQMMAAAEAEAAMTPEAAQPAELAQPIEFADTPRSQFFVNSEGV